MAKVINTFRSRLARREAYRRTLNELNALSDREAADLGLNRVDFVRVAREATYGF